MSAELVWERTRSYRLLKSMGRGGGGGEGEARDEQNAKNEKSWRQPRDAGSASKVTSARSTAEHAAIHSTLWVFDWLPNAELHYSRVYTVLLVYCDPGVIASMGLFVPKRLILRRRRLIFCHWSSFRTGTLSLPCCGLIGPCPLQNFGCLKLDTSTAALEA